MEVTVVTSFSHKGYDDYGHAMVESLLRQWEGLRLQVYSESAIPALAGLAAARDEVELHDLLRASPACADFLRRHANNAVAQGRLRVPNSLWKPKDLERGYNFRYDAYKFARKVFAIEAASRRVTTGWLLWVDGDVVATAPVSEAMVRDALRGDIAYLDRGSYHSECGFVGYRVANPEVRRFIADFAALYESDKVFDLREWHDSWVFDWLRGQRSRKLRFYPIPHGSPAAPVDTMVPMAGALTHHKGERKREVRRRLAT